MSRAQIRTVNNRLVVDQTTVKSAFTAAQSEMAAVLVQHFFFIFSAFVLDYFGAAGSPLVYPSQIVYFRKKAPRKIRAAAHLHAHAFTRL